MATVLLVRHGRTQANSDGILAGRSPGTSLDDLGVDQARALGQALVGFKPTAVIASPLERTMRTAELISSALSAPDGSEYKIVQEVGLTECDYGDWTGKALSELAVDPLWRAVQDHPSSVKFPGETGESMAAMQSRAVAAIRSWNDVLGPDAMYIAVSHGDVIKSIIADSLGLHLDNFQRIVVDPGSISVIRYSELRPFVVSVNGDGSKIQRFIEESQRSHSDAAVGGGAA